MKDNNKLSWKDIIFRKETIEFTVTFIISICILFLFYFVVTEDLQFSIMGTGILSGMIILAIIL